MWPTSTEPARRALRALLLALAATTLAACGGTGTRPEGDAATATGPDPAVVADFDAALAALAAGDEAAAESRLAALAAAEPGYAGPLVNLAMIRARRDDLDAAAELLVRATRACTRCAPAWTQLGMVQRRQGRFAEAEQSYLRAIDAEPAYADAWFNLGVLYDLYLQRPEFALERYERFAQLQAGGDAGDVAKWIADLQRRTGSVQRAAQAEAAP